MTDQPHLSAGDVGSFVIGGMAGVLAGGAMRRQGRRGDVLGSGMGLLAAAAIYPLARRTVAGGGLGLELGTAAASIALTGVAARHHDSTTARRLIAGGWAAHAAFDLLRGPSPDSRLPRTYPALCAGFDLALALRLAR